MVNFRQWFRFGDPTVGAEAPPTARAQVRASAPYEAGSMAPRVQGWNPPDVSAAATTASVTTIRNRCRHAIRNDAWAKAIIDTLVDDLIGWGVKPLSRAPGEPFRQAVQQLFEDWAAVADADGRFDFYGLQAAAVREWLSGGECFIRLRPRRPEDGLPVPLQVQLLPAESCPADYQRTVEGGTVVEGIEFDLIGRRRAYYLRDVAADELGSTYSEPTRVPASQVLHLFESLRPGQRRGIPVLAPALVRLHELDKYADATLLRLQMSNLFVGTIRQPMSDGSYHPLTGTAEDMATAQAGRPVTLQSGILQQLDPGEELTFNDPPDPPAGFSEFVRHELRAAGAAVGVPMEAFTHDWGATNDRLARVVLNQYRRRVHRLLWTVVVPQVLKPLYSEWIRFALTTKLLPVDPETYIQDRQGRVSFSPHAHAYVHPVQDVASYREAIKAGLTSRQAAVAETGEDAEVIDAQQEADNRRADGKGLKYTSDARQSEGGAE
jgi:lambda family phage portal protein